MIFRTTIKFKFGISFCVMKCVKIESKELKIKYILICYDNIGPK